MRRPAKTPIDISAMTRKIDADNRIPLRNYYRIADNLLKQADIYRAEKNIIDLYIILLRYSSLVSETIPYHRDYQALYPKERSYFKKMLLKVIDELESLKPEFRRRLDEMDRVSDIGQVNQCAGLDRIWGGSAASTSERPAINYKTSLNFDGEKLPGNKQMLSPWKQKNDYNHISSSNSMDMQLQKLSIGLPLPKQETLSRHSFLGPNGLRGRFVAPTTEIKVNYPANTDLSHNEIISLNQVGQDDHLLIRGGISKVDNSTMESVLSLDDGRWSRPAEELDPQFNSVPSNGGFSFDIIRQPLPPPVLAQVQPEYLPISPSEVADPRPGPAKTFQDGMSDSNSYHDLHIPVKMMDNFLRLARENTARNLETCGVLAGSLRNRVFHITALIIPKQESTSDSCQTLNEEEIFDVQDKHSLFPLGWIHTHPSQTCFMSSVDLHTHYSYQIMLPEAVAIVMAPKDESSPHGIFHLSDPGGVGVIRNCQQRGFHPHEEPEDGSPIYEHCSHVYMNPNLKFDVIDLR